MPDPGILDWGDWRTWGSAGQVQMFGAPVLDKYSLQTRRDGRRVTMLNPKGGPLSSNVPVRVDAAGALKGKKIVAIAAVMDDAPTDYRFKLALCSDGTLAGWGVLDTMHPPVQLPPSSSGRATDRSVVNPTVCLVPARVKTDALGGRKITAIAAGCGSAMALTQDGLVYEWGLHAGFPVVALKADDDYPRKLQAMFAARGRFFDHFSPKRPEGLTTLFADDDLDVQLSQNTLGRAPLEKSLVLDDPVPVNFGAMKGRKAVAISYDSASGDAVVLCSDGAVVSWGAVWQFALNDRVQGTLGLGMPAVINDQGLMRQKTVTAVAGHVALCSDGTLLRWPSALDGKVVAFVVNGPGSVLSGKKIVKITPGFALCSDGTLATWDTLLGNALTTVSTEGERHDLTGIWGIDDRVFRFDDPLLKGKTVADVAGDAADYVIRCTDGTLLRSGPVASWGKASSAKPVDMLNIIFEPTDRLPAEAVDASLLPQGAAVFALAPEMILFGDKPEAKSSAAEVAP